MEQLSMVHPAPASVGAPVAGEGIALRTFRSGEEQAWADIINATDLGADYGVAKVRETLTGKSRFDPEGLFLACDSATGRPLATACAWRSFVFGRSRPTLHMVAARPEASGRGLGKLVCQAVLDYFARRGEQEVVLTTDDHRLPAIATYLQVGLRPMRYVRGEDHAGRWKAILEKLSGIRGGGEFSGPGRPVKVAVLGLRRGADIAGYVQGHAAGEVTAACDRDEQRRDEFRARFEGAEVVGDYEALLAGDAEAVMVANDCPDHAPAAMAALAAGKDVLSEVTAFHTPAEGVALVEAVGAAARSYMLAENCLYSNPMIELAYQAAEGVLGDLQYAEGDYVHDCRSLMAPDGRPHWRGWFPPLLYSTHPLGPILRAAGARPLRVVGMHTGARLAGTAGGIDMGAMLIAMTGGAVVRIAAALAVNREPASLWVCYYGTQASLETDRWNDKVHLHDGRATQSAGPVSYRPTGRGKAPHTTAGHFGADPRMMEYWIESLANGLASPINVHEAADMTLPGILAHRSSLEAARAIEVPDFRDGASRDAFRGDRARPDPANPMRMIDS